jgi:hypothetical protein
MREFRTYGSVRGVPSNGHPYRDENNALKSGVPATTLTEVPPFAGTETTVDSAQSAMTEP